MSRAAFKRAVKLVGGTSAMARKLSTSPSRISNWLKRGMPEREAIHVEAATIDQSTGQPRVRREELAPSLYPSPKRPRAARSSRAHATSA